MTDLFQQYENITKQIKELEDTEIVQSYLKKIEEKEIIVSELRNKSIENEENFMLSDCTINIQRKIKISYNEEKIKQELPKKYETYLIFDSKAAASDPELNDYSIVDETLYTVVRKNKSEEHRS